jgi:hypothetical protein
MMTVRTLALAMALTALSALVAAQTQIPVATTIKTAKGEFRVPGPAFIDGRHLDTEPRYTAVSLQLWQSPERRQGTCSVDHGTEVQLLEVQRNTDEQRYYFRLRAPKCEGWVRETEISPRKMAPLGPRK